MANNVDPGFPGKPTVYPYVDPNNSTIFTVDPNAPDPMNQIPTSSTYVWGYMTRAIDTTFTATGASFAQGSQQSTNEALRFKDGTTPSGASSTSAPFNKHQLEAPSVGGYYDSADTANTSPQPW